MNPLLLWLVVSASIVLGILAISMLCKYIYNQFFRKKSREELGWVIEEVNENTPGYDPSLNSDLLTRIERAGIAKREDLGLTLPAATITDMSGTSSPSFVSESDSNTPSREDTPEAKNDTYTSMAVSLNYSPQSPISPEEKDPGCMACLLGSPHIEFVKHNHPVLRPGPNLQEIKETIRRLGHAYN